MEKKTVLEARKIGKYQILSEIGRGGFGRVFKVFDPDLQVERAIKVPFSQGDNIGKALEEARNQAQISHPAVVQVHEVEKIDGRWVIVMDYESGESLRDRLETDGPLGIEESIQCIEELAGALGEAHRKNPPLLHYDIKPENILFDEKGNVKLADFGISRRMEQAGKKMSRVIGTVEYMGPEQLDGFEDRRSEIWSLGAVFYEMLTGQVCFEGETDSRIIAEITKGRFRPLRKLNPDIPKSLEKIVNKMLALNPDQRYQTMESLVEDLKTFKESESRQVRRSLTPLILSFILVVLLSFAGGVMYAHKVDILNLPFLQRFGKIEPIPLPEAIKGLNFQGQFNAALAEIDKGEYHLAYQILKNIEEGSGDARLREKAGFYKASLALNYMKDNDLALVEFKSFLKKYPESPFAGDAHFFLGGVYYEKKHDLIKSIKHLTTVIDRYPQNSRIQTAEFLIQDAAKQLAREGKSVGLIKKSFPGGLLPNNWISLVVSILGLISSISLPLAWIMSQYHQPEIANVHSVRSGFKGMLKHRALKKLIMIVILSQILSFALNHYQSSLDYHRSTNALQKVGVDVEKR